MIDDNEKRLRAAAMENARPRAELSHEQEERDLWVQSGRALRDEIERLRAELEETHRALTLGGKANLSLMKTCEEYQAELAAERERVEKLSQENAVLRCDAAGEREQVETLKYTVIGLEMDKRELREALEPFAQDNYSDNWDDASGIEVSVQLGDLRRARAVLKETGGGDE
jgi:chromosome segregation ATPase